MCYYETVTRAKLCDYGTVGKVQWYAEICTLPLGSWNKSVVVYFGLMVVHLSHPIFSLSHSQKRALPSSTNVHTVCVEEQHIHKQRFE